MGLKSPVRRLSPAILLDAARPPRHPLRPPDACACGGFLRPRRAEAQA